MRPKNEKNIKLFSIDKISSKQLFEEKKKNPSYLEPNLKVKNANYAQRYRRPAFHEPGFRKFSSPNTKNNMNINNQIKQQPQQQYLVKKISQDLNEKVKKKSESNKIKKPEIPKKGNNNENQKIIVLKNKQLLNPDTFDVVSKSSRQNKRNNNDFVNININLNNNFNNNNNQNIIQKNNNNFLNIYKLKSGNILNNNNFFIDKNILNKNNIINNNNNNLNDKKNNINNNKTKVSKMNNDINLFNKNSNAYQKNLNKLLKIHTTILCIFFN